MPKVYRGPMAAKGGSPTPELPKVYRAVLVPESRDQVINAVGLSQDFQRLLTRLAQQHLLELAEQRKDMLREGGKNLPAEAQTQIARLQSEVDTLRRIATSPSKPMPPQVWEVSEVDDTKNLLDNGGPKILPGMPSSDSEDSESEAESEKKEPKTNSTDPVKPEAEDENEATASKEEEEPQGFYAKMARLLSSVKCDLFIGVLILINVIFMFLQCHYDGMEIGYRMQPNGTVYDEDFPYWLYYPMPSAEAWPGMGDFLHGVDLLFTIIFTIDVTLKIVFLGLPFWKSALNLLDVVVVCLGLYALANTAFQNPSYLRMLRLAKMGRLAGALANSPAAQSLQMLLKCIGNCVNTLGWSLAVLLVIQCIMGLTISSLVQTLLEDSESPLPEDVRRTLFYFYGTFTKTILTMFQILFANWVPCARVLIDNVSEVFTLVFLFYRCLVGFAVMSVISAVFVQSTMKVAQQDQELLVAAKQRERDATAKNMKTLFEAIDTSGDGALSEEELLAVVDDPKMAVFMHALEIDTKDLKTLFDLLDDGDGEISIDEFLGGIGRLRGAARAIDLATVTASCSKIEKLLMEMKTGQDQGKSKQALAMKDW